MSGSAPGQTTRPTPSATGQSYTTDQWLRKWQLTVYNPTSVGPSAGQALVLSAGSDVPGQEALRCRFEVINTAIPTPNVACIRIYNPAPATVKKVVNEFTRVTLSAGYQNGRFGTIFDGWITQFKFGGETPVDKFLDITAQDGDLAFTGAVVNRVLMPGFNHPQSIAESIMQAMGPKGAVSNPDVSRLGLTPSARPTVLYGSALDHFYTMQKSTNTVWSLQQGKLVVIPANGANVAGKTWDINALTGLVGFPTETNDGIEFRTLLNPFVSLGSFVRINNAEINQTVAGVGGSSGRFTTVLTSGGGHFAQQFYATTSDDGTYLVASVSYRGDTRGQDWYSDFIGITVDPQTGNVTAAQEIFPTPADIASQRGDSTP